jgi:hypothetical protein
VRRFKEKRPDLAQSVEHDDHRTEETLTVTVRPGIGLVVSQVRAW